MSPHPRVLTIYYKHKPGGFCKRLQMKIETYLEQGWKVHYIAVEPFPYQHPNLTPHILPAPFKNHDTLLFWVYFFSLAPWFTAWVAYKEKIQLLSTFSLTYACLCAPAKWITGAPLLTFVRTMKEKKEFGRAKMIFRLERLLEKAGVSLSNSLVANSQSIKIELEKIDNADKAIQVIYNHIEECNFDKPEQRKRVLKEFGLQEDSILLVTTGLLIPRKNLHFVLKAFAKVDSNKAVLILIGEGPLHDSLQSLSKQLELEDKVIFTGWRDDVLEILAGCDLFVFSSRLEGLSNSILEAMACGLPCLVSDIQENREIITQSEQRFPVDQPEVLARMINEVFSSNEKMESFRNSSLEDRNRFIFNWKGKLIEKAEEVIKSHQARKRLT